MIPVLDGLRRDIRHGTRGLLGSPGLLAVSGRSEFFSCAGANSTIPSVPGRQRPRS